MNQKATPLHALKQANTRNRALSERFEVLKNRVKNIRNRIEGGYIGYDEIEDTKDSVVNAIVEFKAWFDEFDEVTKSIRFIKAELTKLEGDK